MLMSGTTKRRTYLISIISVMLLIVISLVGCGSPVTSLKPRPTGPVSASLNMFKDAPGLESTSDKYTSVTEASKNTSFPVLMPKNTLGHQLSGIYIERDVPKETKGATLVFTNGVNLMEKPMPEAVTYEGIVKTFKELNSQASSDPVPLPTRVIVGGHEGFGDDAGFTVVDGKKTPAPGFIEWSDEKNVNYQLYGDGMTLNDLRQIAQSAY